MQYLKTRYMSPTTVYFEAAATSDEEKPKTWANRKIVTGSQIIEVDTSKVFLYDSKAEIWHEFN